MIYVTKFRANDLNPSKGKQIEFNSGVIENFFQFTTPQANAEFKCISLENSSIIRNVKVSFSLSPARGDYKVYQNPDGSMDLKDFFLDVLHLTRAANIDDYYAIRKTTSDRYTLYYIPKSLIFSSFFDKISGDQMVYFDEGPDSEGESGIDEGEVGSGKATTPAQKIFYGCPGTGKSFEVKRLTEENHGAGVIYFDEDGKRIETPETDEEKEKTPSNIFRTTFHPDYDYATFVGCYKPVMREESIEEGQVVKKLSYEFIPQVFTNAYVRAWKSLVATDLDGAERNVYLIIEEINRGNCAQIFGDLFQLLDRKDGKSEYPIAPDKDIADYLKEQKVPYERLVLPPNLHIYATMNTSDQSLFPMDSAFKRRWDMEYVAIDYKHPDASKFIFAIGQDKKGNDTAATRHYRWIDFLAAVNAKIVDATSSEDKQMGDFFIRKNISEKEFTNKVMFYLWNDICKELYSPRRVQPAYFLRVGTKPTDGSKDYFTFAQLFDDSNKNSRLLFEFMKYLGLKSIEEPDKKDDDNAPAPDVTQPLNTETPQTQE